MPGWPASSHPTELFTLMFHLFIYLLTPLINPF